MERSVRQRSSLIRWQRYSFGLATVIPEKNNDKVCLRVEI